jgi:uncharacterized membrane protein YesL
MRALADPESKLFSLLNKMTLLMELNIWVIVCCLPVVTVGAALSSMHTVLLKIYRGEEKRVTADFFRAMKSNLKNGTLLWLLFLGYLSALLGLWLWTAYLAPAVVRFVGYGLALAALVGLLWLDWALILQSRYVYGVMQCLQNALLAWLKYPGSTLVFLVSLAIPPVLCLSIPTMPLLLLIGITLPHFISTTLYTRVFDRMEGVPEKIP